MIANMVAGNSTSWNSGYVRAMEIRLNPNEFPLSDASHFKIANEAFADYLTENPAVEEATRMKFGDSFVESLLDGKTPEGWTWHHALKSQANGEAGWLQLVDAAEHESNFGLFHPNGFGGYQEWAVPAGAPCPR